MSQSSARNNERLSTSLPVIVKFKESDEVFWKESTQTISASRNGAGFFLKHKCPVGQLLSLIVALPKHLRSYDEDKELYRIWGLVQHCSQVVTEEATNYHVGVAFIGKDAPSNYKNNPSQSYKISGMNEDGLWKITAAERSFVNRKNPRYWISLDVTLELPDAPEDDELKRETTVTENVSVCGAAVLSNLNLKVDDNITVKIKEFDFSALAVVRNIQTETGDRPKVHLEFIDAKFPIEKIILPAEGEAKN